jgi:hypothetical protein
MSLIEPQAANELMPLSYSIVDAPGGHAAILMVGDEPCFTLGDFDTPEAAEMRMKEITAKALTAIITSVYQHETEDETEESVENDGFVWHPSWVSDLQVDNWARLVNRDANPVVIRRIEVTARPEGVSAEYMPDVPVFMIYFHPGDDSCPGHHYAGPGRAPAWVGEPVPVSSVPDAIEET